MGDKTLITIVFKALVRGSEDAHPKAVLGIAHGVRQLRKRIKAFLPRVAPRGEYGDEEAANKHIADALGHELCIMLVDLERELKSRAGGEEGACG